MLLLIDNTFEGIGSSPREIRSALQQLEPDLRVVTEPFNNITPEFVKVLSPSHIILSGQSHPWDQYSSESLAGVFYVIRTAPQPILGVCGGQQQIALAFGAPASLPVMVMKERFGSVASARSPSIKRQSSQSSVGCRKRLLFGNHIVTRSRNCRRILPAPRPTRSHQFKPCDTSRAPCLASSSIRNSSMKNIRPVAPFSKTFSICEIAARRMIFCVRVSAPGGNEMHHPTQRACRSDPGDARHNQPDDPNQNSAVINLANSGK